MRYIDASHNMLFTLNDKKWREDLGKSNRGDITGYQEAEGSGQRSTLKAWCEETDRGLYHPTHTGNPISWRNAMFDEIKDQHGVIEHHPSALQMGVPAKFNPARDTVWVGLTHKQSNARILRINVHPLAGGTKPENNPDNKDSKELSEYKDWGIGQYWLDIVSFTAAQMSLQRGGKDSMVGWWDIVTIGVDYNAALSNRGRWYYPANLLSPLFVADSQTGGLDHMQHARGSDCKTLRRWTEKGNTDHRLQFIEREFVEVADFPREM